MIENWSLFGPDIGDSFHKMLQSCSDDVLLIEDGYGCTALHKCADLGEHRVMQMLLE
jgi:hypothetical protein